MAGIVFGRRSGVAVPHNCLRLLSFMPALRRGGLQKNAPVGTSMWRFCSAIHGSANFLKATPAQRSIGVAFRLCLPRSHRTGKPFRLNWPIPVNAASFWWRVNRSGPGAGCRSGWVVLMSPGRCGLVVTRMPGCGCPWRLGSAVQAVAGAGDRGVGLEPGESADGCRLAGTLRRWVVVLLMPLADWPGFEDPDCLAHGAGWGGGHWFLARLAEVVRLTVRWSGFGRVLMNARCCRCPG